MPLEPDGPGRSIEVTLVEAPACHLCDEASQALLDVSSDYPLSVRHVGIASGQEESQ